MGAGVDLADKIEKEHDDFMWNDTDNDLADDYFDDIKALNSTEFNAFMERLPDGTRDELLNSADEDDRNLHTTDEYREIYNALKNEGDREEYVRKLVTEEKKVEDSDFANGAGGAAALGEGDYLKDADGNGLVNLWVPRGATPMLKETVEDTQFAMQEGLNSLGSGDPKSWLGFTNILAGADIESADGWSNIIDQHAEKKEVLDTRATDYTEKHKDVEIHTHEAEVFKDGLWKDLLTIKDGLNNDRLMLDLEKIGYEKKDDNRIVLTQTADKFQVDGEGMEHANMAVNGEGGERVLYRKNVEGDAMTAERGFEGEGSLYYLTPEAEWHFYVKHIDQAAEDWDKKYTDAMDRMQRGASKVDEDPGGDEDKDGEETAEEAYQRGLEAGRKEAGGGDTPGANTPGADTPGADTPGADTPGTENQDFSDTFDDLLDKEKPEDATGGGSDEDGDGKDDKDSALDKILQPIRDAITGGGAAGAAGAAAGDGGMMSMMMPMMMMSMIPQMMQQMMQQKKEDEDSERDEQERDEEPQSAPAPSPGPAPAAPAAAPPGATAPPAQTDVPAPAVSDTPKSMVDMKLPDGTSQRVSSVVSEAINRELNNPNGSDARAAYQGTPGEATAGSPWVSVESSAVGTGDIAQWENRSALVVVTDSGLQAIVNGQLVPLDPHNPPDGGQGGYGEFRGFFHPSGADISDANDTAVGAAPPEPPPVTAAAPPPGATAPPAVTPPATMEVR